MRNFKTWNSVCDIFQNSQVDSHDNFKFLKTVYERVHAEGIKISINFKKVEGKFSIILNSDTILLFEWQ